jgi:hypothetical protein
MHIGFSGVARIRLFPHDEFFSSVPVFPIHMKPVRIIRFSCETVNRPFNKESVRSHTLSESVLYDRYTEEWSICSALAGM